MAPNRSTPSNKGDKDVSAPLEGPISLLWAYQLRREHASLLSRIEGLAVPGRNEDTTAQIKTLSLETKALMNRITAAEKESDSQCHDLKGIRGRISGIDETVSQIQLDIARNEKQYKQQIESVLIAQSNLVEQTKAEIVKIFDTKFKEQKEQIRQLQNKTLDFEGQIIGLAQQEVTVVRDSVEDIPLPNFRKPQLVNNSNVAKKIDHSRHKDFSHADDLLRDVEEDSNMQTLHPIQREDETPETEFDLDAGVATMSYARHLRGRRSTKQSMVMLPELGQAKQHLVQGVDQHISLQQDLRQPWDQYLKQGRDLVGLSQKRKEGTIVDSFVAGITDLVLRGKCEHWLDDRIWIWENVESFAAQRKQPEASPVPCSTADATPRPRRAGGGIQLPKRASDSQVVSRELAKLLDDQSRRRVESLVVAVSPGPEEPRRSQRIAKKTDARSQQTEKTQHIVPPPARNAKGPAERNEKPSQKHRKTPKVLKPQAKFIEQRPTQVWPERTVTTDSKQTVASTKIGTMQHEQHQPVKSAARTLHNHAQNPEMQLGDISDPNLRAKVQKMRDIFPIETIGKCHEALMAHKGNLSKAKDWLFKRLAPLQEPKSMTNPVAPSTPTPIARFTNVLHPAHPEAVNKHPDQYKTPEHRIFIGRTSYKRKLDPMEQEQVANMKKARPVKKKRGPPPAIPILPSSDSERE